MRHIGHQKTARHRIELHSVVKLAVSSHLVSLQFQSFGVAQLVAQELLQGTARVAKPMLPDGCRGVIHVHPLFDTNLLYSANGQIGTYSTFSGSKTKLIFNVCADERIKT